MTVVEVDKDVTRGPRLTVRCFFLGAVCSLADPDPDASLSEASCSRFADVMVLGRGV